MEGLEYGLSEVTHVRYNDHLALPVVSIDRCYGMLLCRGLYVRWREGREYEVPCPDL